MARFRRALRLRSILNLFLFFGLPALVSAQQPSPTSTQSTVRGTVVDVSGQPVDAASVFVEQGSSTVAQTTTDRQGVFAFKGLMAGRYAVHAEKAGVPSDAADVEV